MNEKTKQGAKEYVLSIIESQGGYSGYSSESLKRMIQSPRITNEPSYEDMEYYRSWTQEEQIKPQLQEWEFIVDYMDSLTKAELARRGDL